MSRSLCLFAFSSNSVPGKSPHSFFIMIPIFYSSLHFCSLSCTLKCFSAYSPLP
uniref:Uncharacterized protein n=1 Tax=Rhizophora mucronata TaxID=61149 RepID=A0A2P2N5Y0_RHIMU